MLPTGDSETAPEVVGEDDFELWNQDIQDVIVQLAKAGIANARKEKRVLDIAVQNELTGSVAFIERGDFGGPGRK